jgi:hypothetical protein
MPSEEITDLLEFHMQSPLMLNANCIFERTAIANRRKRLWVGSEIVISHGRSVGERYSVTGRPTRFRQFALRLQKAILNGLVINELPGKPPIMMLALQWLERGGHTHNN